MSLNKFVVQKRLDKKTRKLGLKDFGFEKNLVGKQFGLEKIVSKKFSFKKTLGKKKVQKGFGSRILVPNKFVPKF